MKRCHAITTRGRLRCWCWCCRLLKKHSSIAYTQGADFLTFSAAAVVALRCASFCQASASSAARNSSCRFAKAATSTAARSRGVMRATALSSANDALLASAKAACCASLAWASRKRASAAWDRKFTVWALGLAAVKPSWRAPYLSPTSTGPDGRPAPYLRTQQEREQEQEREQAQAQEYNGVEGVWWRF